MRGTSRPNRNDAGVTRRGRLGVLAVVVTTVLSCLVAARDAAAQTSTGVVEGHVFDQMGAPLSGVRVTASSPTQIGGAKTAYSDAEGGFHFGALTPGTFQVRASAPKMKTMVQEAVKVGLSGAVTVDLIMEVETADEQVIITTKAPVINTKSARVKEIIDGDFVEGLPGANRNWNDLLRLAAGTEGQSVRGSGGNRSAANLDGFNTISPNNGEPAQLVSSYSMAATEITTAAAGAGFGSTTGGVVEMVTRSGSNRLEVEAELRYREPRTVEFFQEAGEDDRDEYWLQGIVNLGGPLIRDRLWYYLSFEGLFITRYPLNPTTSPNVAGQRKPDESPPNRYQRPNFLQKISYQATPRNKVDLLVLTTPQTTRYQGWSNYNLDPEADSYNDRLSLLLGATWQALLTDNLFNRFQVGYQFLDIQGGPMKCRFGNESTCMLQPKITNTSAGGYQYSNAGGTFRDKSAGLQFKNATEYYLESKAWGAHAFTLGLDLNFVSRYYEETKSGGGAEFQVQQTSGGVVPYKQTVYCPTDLTTAGGECKNGKLARTVPGTKLDAFVQDGWRMTKYLTLTPGLGFHRGSYQNNEGKTVFAKSGVTPHLAVAWDATHDGRTVLRSSYNQYVDLAGLQIADYVARGWSSRTCEWDANTSTYEKNCTFSNGAPNGTRRISPSIGTSRTHEVTLGAEREIVQGVALGADVVYKLYVNQLDDFEVNRVWNQGGTDVTVNGGYLNGQPQSIQEIRTSALAKRRYLGTTVQLQKREGAARASVAYTWSQLRGRQPSSGDFSYTTGWGNNPGQDVYYGYNSYLPNDRRHVIIVKGIYQVTDWLQFGAIYTFKTGTPYNQLFYNTLNGGFSDLHAQQGTSAGANVNDPVDDKPLRLPDLTQLDLQGRINLKRFVGINLQAFCDYNNILALRGTTSVQQNDGPAFGAPSGRQSASYLQAGLHYVY